MIRSLPLAIALLLSAALPAAAQPSAVQTRTSGALTLENIPPTPPALRGSLQRYQNSRSATLEGWLPDGSALIATRFGSTPQLHRVAAPGAAREQLTFYDEPISEAATQPNGGGRYAFTKDLGGAEYFQLFTAAPGAPAQRLSEEGTRNQSVHWSNDGSLLLWSSVKAGQPDYDLMVMRSGDPASRRAVMHGPGEISALDVSPDNRTVLVRHYLSVTDQKLFLLDLATGRSTPVNPASEPVAYEAGRFAPDGRSLILISDQGGDMARLVRLELASGRSTPLGPALAGPVEAIDLSPDGRRLAFAVNEGGPSRIGVLDLASGRPLPAPPFPVGVLTGMKWSSDGRRLGVSLNRATSPGDVYSWTVADGRIERWTASETGGLDPAQLSEPSLIRFRSFDGRQIPAFLYRPRRPASGKLPVIISIHGGPEAQERAGFNPAFQYWTNELGAVVITPNVRGSDGFGKTYLGLDNGFKRQDSVKDIGALLDWIAAQPDLDAKRVVVGGGSYGGFMTLSVYASYGDRLAGAYAQRAISNLVTFLERTEGYRRDLRRVEYGDERDPKMRAFMLATAPMTNTAKMRAPLLLVDGRNDPRVPYTEGRQIAAKLRGQGTEVWSMLAADEGHGYRKKPNIDAQREAETLFYIRTLGVSPAELQPASTPSRSGP